MKRAEEKDLEGGSVIRRFQVEDINAMCDIYNSYTKNSVATFDTDPFSYRQMREKMEPILEKYPAYIYEELGEIIGFCYASSFRNKPAYQYTAEVTVYTKEGQSGKNIGSKLYEVLIPELKKSGFRTLTSLITSPNEASVKLHKKFGFKQKCVMEKVGYKFERWLDVIYMECQLF